MARLMFDWETERPSIHVLGVWWTDRHGVWRSGRDGGEWGVVQRGKALELDGAVPWGEESARFLATVLLDPVFGPLNDLRITLLDGGRAWTIVDGGRVGSGCSKTFDEPVDLAESGTAPTQPGLRRVRRVVG